jgi:Flp pilus assembly protein TadG
MGATIKTSKIVSAFKKLISNESGNAAIVTGMAAIPMILIMGSAVDFERASNLHTELQSSVDAAALFAATLQESNNTLLTQKAKPYFEANFKADGASETPAFTVINDGDSVRVEASVVSNNAFMKIAGVPTTTVGARSVVKKSGIKLEVSLVLDNTTSMGTITSPATTKPIDDLIKASTKFIDLVMPATQGQYYTKIALVPYNNGVNLGGLASMARGSTVAGISTSPGADNYTFSTNRFDGSYNLSCSHDANGYCQQTLPITDCVTERTGVDAYTDASVSGSPVGRSYLNSSNPCSVQQIVPLTTSAKTLTDTIKNMTASGSTAGQVGIAWGWYTLSPTIGMWSGASTPAGYDKLTTSDSTQKVKKVMILMTDGEYNSANYNGVIAGLDPVYGSTGYPYYGSVPGSGGSLDHINHAASNGNVYTQANAMCSAIKAAKIEVYVITFQLKTAYTERKALTDNCATDSNHVLNADTSSLDATFLRIANQLQQMRIAQ